MKNLDAPLPFLIRNRVIAGNDSPVRNFHDESGIILTAIRVDQQPRKPSEHRRNAKTGRERARQPFYANIKCDMPMKSGLRKAKFAVVCRQKVHRVVRQKNHAFVIFAFYDFIRYEVVHR